MAVDTAFELLALPFVAALLLVAIHTAFGLQVLARGVIFVDLALAQVAALGATVAFMLGHAVTSVATFGYSLAFTFAAALLLASSRAAATRIPQEALIGVLYVVAAAAAFLLVDKIVKKLDPEAKPLDSQLFVPDQALYTESVKDNGSSAYQDVDIEGAKKLLNGATPEVRIMYNKDNPNRADMFALISESAAKAGFKIVDGGLGKSDWGKALGDGSYDATIFGWINSGVGVSGVPQIFKSGNDSNFNQFSDPEADKLMEELIVTTDKGKQDALIKQIDQKIWASAYGLPLFQAVGVDAYSDRITGVKYMPNQTGVWWNFWEWAQK